MKIEYIKLKNNEYFECKCGAIKILTKATEPYSWGTNFHCNNCNTYFIFSDWKWNSDEVIILKITSKQSISYYQWIKNLKIIAKRIEEIYKDFNNNICSSCKRPSCCKNEVTKSLGCCGNCSTDWGYFNIKKPIFNGKRIFIHNTYLNIEKKDDINTYWIDDEFGFYNIKKHCCNLPRYLRSFTCLDHCCDNDIKSKAHDDVVLLKDIKRLIGFPR